VRALPLICSFLAALIITPAACRSLVAGPLARENFRGVRLAAPLGIPIVAAALLALAPLALAQKLAGGTLLLPELTWIAAFVLGVALLGLVDDALSGPGRGWRGHFGALRAGQPDTGVLKAIGTLALALVVMLGAGGTERFLLGAAVLVLATNVFNLVDLRPGRAVKGLIVIGAVLTIASGDVRPLWALGLFVGPALVVGFYDLREQGMLGDTGASLLGALAGVWLVLTLSATGLIFAVVALAGISVYGEFHSISALIDRAPLLRQLDSLGRVSDALDA
jgi:UDP-GlcNAc:undecaprenyl-phosphate GlcNAc-1-phosphate transferase